MSNTACRIAVRCLPYRYRPSVFMPSPHRSLVIVVALIAACTSGKRDPLADVPLAQWRQTNVDARHTTLPNGHIVAWPVDGVLGCSTESQPTWPTCLYEIDRIGGKTLSGNGYRPDRLRVQLELDPTSYPGIFAMARGHADQWAESTGPDPSQNTPYQGAVRSRLQDRLGEHAYWVGCWKRYDGYPFGYGCSMALDLGDQGAALVEFEAPETADDVPTDARRNEARAIAQHVVALRASLEGAPPAGR
ncbi:hypothetical protein [Xanthomonas sp. NCPPB 2632]|uniref:hypothetical protein n=1 Tax=Xanthomonas sp. NCPPB 2632 TaxID=3240912 RepID=UPI0035178B45